ncbi:hypothetical protein CAPTEDRAFT_195930 [Capitella teleta]|uniref:Uncharacterized protein n=1 Tax=Capitella teleta TaxID=283909 RepID=R7UL76_CAPTE|nr:hypothetical protein CAPTEDRAFT_195930 [Capitella teleta]|eukprot:ELU07294.1 hypothetical protein CAPTEDRAFT_195930 [Capitella teleta]
MFDIGRTSEGQVTKQCVATYLKVLMGYRFNNIAVSIHNGTHLQITVPVSQDEGENKQKGEFVDYAASSTIHGLRNAVDPSNGKIRRVVWAIMLLSLLAYFAFAISLRVRKLRSYPVSSRTRVIEVDEALYPAMTICNLNQIKKSYVADDNFLKNVFLALNEFTAHTSNVSLNDANVLDKIEDEYSLRQMFHDGAFTLEEMIYMCFWQKQAVNCSNYFTQTFTSMGYCYTLNSAELIEKKGRLSTSQIGVKQGFSFYVNVGQENYFYQDGYSAGIRLLVHDPYEFPLVEASGIAIGPGMETFLSVSETKIKKMPPPYGGSTCVDTNDVNFKNPLKYFNEYSQSRCTQDCFMDYVVRECECVVFGVEINRTYLTNSTHLKQCGCQSTCSKSVFHVTKSEAYYPSERKSEELMNLLPFAPDDLEQASRYFRQNYLLVNLFMSELSYSLYEEEAAYSLGDFQSDVGGNLGLCLGASFLSIAELLEFLLIGIIGLAYKISTWNKIATPVPMK